MPHVQYTRPCENCGESFSYTKPSSNRRYCSQPCALKARRGETRAKRPVASRFWPKVNKESGLWWEGTPCWVWIASFYDNGYGQFYDGARNVAAHRFSFALANASIPTGLYVLHHCDNRACVNPAHLFLGTHQDNMDDMDRKGRRPRGDSHPARIDPSYLVRGDNHPARKDGSYLLRGDKHPARRKKHVA